MVRLFCSEVQVEETSFETLVSIYSRLEGTSFVINFKDMQFDALQGSSDEQQLLAEELQEAIRRFYIKTSPSMQLKAV